MIFCRDLLAQNTFCWTCVRLVWDRQVNKPRETMRSDVKAATKLGAVNRQRPAGSRAQVKPTATVLARRG